jgi:hypothetical protein
MINTRHGIGSILMRAMAIVIVGSLLLIPVHCEASPHPHSLFSAPIPAMMHSHGDVARATASLVIVVATPISDADPVSAATTATLAEAHALCGAVSTIAPANDTDGAQPARDMGAAIAAAAAPFAGSAGASTTERRLAGWLAGASVAPPRDGPTLGRPADMRSMRPVAMLLDTAYDVVLSTLREPGHPVVTRANALATAGASLDGHHERPQFPPPRLAS